MTNNHDEAVKKELHKFVRPCSFCTGTTVATLERYGNSLVYKCVACGQGVTCGDAGKLIDRYAKLRKKNNQEACHYPACDRPAEHFIEFPGTEGRFVLPLCWKHEKERIK